MWSFSVIEVNYIISGLIVGFLTGLTGIGGGSLMTPILILLLGFSPMQAVGTDMLFNAITKIAGVAAFHKHDQIDWKCVKLLLYGSMPTTILTILILRWLDLHRYNIDEILKHAVGWTIIISTLLLVGMTEGKRLIKQRIVQIDSTTGTASQLLTILSGAIIGIIVAFTSIGSGILSTLALFLLYPAWGAVRVLATEMAHAIPLTFVAGFGYMSLGKVDYKLLIGLLVGSLPAIYAGSHLATRIPNRVLRYLMIVILLFVAVQLLLK